MSRSAILAVISLLAEKWPCCFSIPERRRRPLKLGIREDVLAALDGAIAAGKVSAALRWYVSSPDCARSLARRSQWQAGWHCFGTRRSPCSRVTCRDPAEAA